MPAKAELFPEVPPVLPVDRAAEAAATAQSRPGR